MAGAPSPSGRCAAPAVAPAPAEPSGGATAWPWLLGGAALLILLALVRRGRR